MTGWRTQAGRSAGRRVGLLAFAGALALAAGAGPAMADTLVYVKGGAVYVARADGSGARAVTGQSAWWAWPSETDAGIIAVAGGASRITDTGNNASGSDQIFEFDQQGHQVAGPLETQGTLSSVGDPVYVSHLRVAPDNSGVAWTVTDTLVSDPYTSWRNPNGSDSFHVAQDSSGGPLPYSDPEWWGPAHLLITHDGAAFSGQAEYALYGVGDGSSPGWANDQAIGNSGSYQVVFSRDGTKSAVLTNDSADYTDGVPRNVALTLETSSGNLPNTDWTDTGCSITLPASEFSSSSGTHRASVSFSADGSTLAWAQDDGIYEANVADPTNCAAVTGSVHEVVVGGAMPFLSPAPLSPTPPPPPPPPPPKPPTPHKPVVRITHLTVRNGQRMVVVRFAGTGVGPLRFQCRLDGGPWRSCRAPLTLRHLRRGRHVLDIRPLDRAGRRGTTVARRFRIGG